MLYISISTRGELHVPQKTDDKNTNLPRRRFGCSGAMMGCSIAGIPQNSNDTSTILLPDPDSGEVINETKIQER